MKRENYSRALYEAKQDLARHLVKRQKLDLKIARLQSLVGNLQSLSAEHDRKNFESQLDRFIKADLKMGITESTRVILKENFFPLTANEIRTKIEARKLNLARYSNPLAVIHTILKRLIQGGEVRIVPQANGQKAYQWISPADKALAELQQSVRRDARGQGDGKETK
jgi:hypothetical protein